MKATVLQENILKASQDAMRFISSKPQLAILSCFYIQAKEGRITISATDLNTGVQISFGGKVEEEGECVIPAKILLDFISAMPQENITLNLEAETLELISQHTKTNIQGMSVKDYPSFPSMEGENFSLPSDTFIKIIEHAGLGAGIDETRPIFTSMLWDFEEEAHFVCTDGYRMAVYTAPKVEGGKGKLLIPAKILMEVSQVLSHSTSKTVKVTIPEELKHISFSFGETTVFARMIEGEFPDYKRIIAQTFKTECIFPKDEMIRAVKSALIFARESSGIVKWNIGKDRTIVSSSSSSLGKHETVIEVGVKKGDGGEIAFNGKYVLNFLTSVSGDDVWFGMNESLQPGEFRDEKLPEFQYVVMPFRVQS